MGVRGDLGRFSHLGKSSDQPLLLLGQFHHESQAGHELTNELCSPNWPQTVGNAPVSASQELIARQTEVEGRERPSSNPDPPGKSQGEHSVHGHGQAPVSHSQAGKVKLPHP